MKTEKEIKERLKWIIPATIGTEELAIKGLPDEQQGIIKALKWVLED